MTIGEALKFIQHNRMLTEEEMSKGIIGKGTYSKVIHGKQNLSSCLLIKILLENDIDIDYFISLIKKDYSSKESLKENMLSQRMAVAFNNHKINDAEECLREIKKLGTNPLFEQRAIIAVHYLKDQLDSLSLEFKKTIIEEFGKTDNWILNLDMLRLFGSAMMILPPKEIELEMQLFFFRLNRMKIEFPNMIERYAILCCNYLHWKYTYNKHLDNNTTKCINFLKFLPKSSRMFLYTVSGKYYYYLFNNQVEEAKNIKESLLKLGCTEGVENWPI